MGITTNLSLDLSLPVMNRVNAILKKAQGQPETEDPDSELLKEIAGQEIAEESDEQNTFFKLLDYLGRPQRAVAGVLTDLVDGGDFSPIDRVTQALLGNENIGVKDFIDAIAPGKWTNMRLPGWMGGKQIDPLKESLGFVGDILTDPLMALNVFGFINKASRFGAEAQGKLLASPKVKALYDSNAVTVGGEVASQMAVQRSRARRLYGIWEHAKRDPKGFMKATGMTPEEYTKEIEELAGRNYASPVLAERLRKGQASLVSVETPLLLRALGVPQRDMSLIPGLDRKWGAALADGLGVMFHGIAKTPLVSRAVQGVQNIFRTGTGHEGVDYMVQQLTHPDVRLAEADSTIMSIRQLMPDFSDDTVKRVRDAIEDQQGPKNWWGHKEAAIDEDIKPVVEAFRSVMRKQADLHASIPGMEHRIIGSGKKASLLRAHSTMTRAVKKNRPDLIGTLPTTKDLERIADNFGVSAEHQFKDAFPEATQKAAKAHGKQVKKEKLDTLLKAELERAAEIAHDAYGRPSGYFPHIMNKNHPMFEAFQDILYDPKLTYKGKTLAQVFFGPGEARHLKDFSVTQLNQMAINNFPAGFMEEVAAQAREAGGQSLKNWQKWIGMQDKFSMPLYVEDPGQALHHYLTSSIRAVSNQERMNMMVKIGGRELPAHRFTESLGEKSFLLSPTGMRAVHGENWEAKLGAPAAKVYNDLLKKNRLRTNKDLGSLFIKQEDTLMNQARLKAAGVPIYAVDKDVVEGMERFLKVSTDSDEMGNFLKAWDGATNFWKTWTLVPFPGYHLRNVGGMAWAAALGGSFTSFPARAPKIFNYMKQTGLWRQGRPGAEKTLRQAGKAFEAMTIKQPGGKIIEAGEAFQGIVQYKITQGGFLAAEMMENARSVGGKYLFKDKKFLPKQLVRDIAHHKGKLPQSIFWFSNNAENIFRLNHYFHRLEKGDSIYEAAMSVKKFFFDYNELSQFERKVLRRVLPFYSWSRFNTPLQIQALIQQPGKYAALGRIPELLQSEEAKRFPKDRLPGWIGEQVGVPLRINKQTGNLEVAILKSWLSAADIVNVTRPVQTFEDLLHPAPKFIIERLANKNLYTGRDIESFPGEPYPAPFLGMSLTRKQVHAFKQIRLANEANKLVQAASSAGELEASVRWANALGLAPKVHGFDIETLERKRKFETAVRAGKYKKVINIAKKTGNQDIIELYNEKIAEAKKRRKRGQSP